MARKKQPTTRYTALTRNVRDFRVRQPTMSPHRLFDDGDVGTAVVVQSDYRQSASVAWPGCRGTRNETIFFLSYFFRSLFLSRCVYCRIGGDLRGVSFPPDFGDRKSTFASCSSTPSVDLRPYTLGDEVKYIPVYSRGTLP